MQNFAKFANFAAADVAGSLPVVGVRHKPDVRRNGPAVMVLVPTRELAIQIGEEATRFGKPLDITTALAYHQLACKQGTLCTIFVFRNLGMSR